MDKQHYDEMVRNLEQLMDENLVQDKQVYVFGHCNATEELVDLLLSQNLQVVAILDNNMEKYDKCYRGIPICPPESILSKSENETIVCIVARAYAAMAQQLNRMGYKGCIRKLVDYNSFAEYSVSEETVARMTQRKNRGLLVLTNLKEEYPDSFRILCPFSALGDVYIMMSYLPYFLKECNVNKCVICVVGKVCKKVIHLFGQYDVKVYTQKDMDELIQAVIFTQDTNSFIAHQDRPYVINLHKALYVKCIPLDKIYCCGVFGLSQNTVPIEASVFTEYKDLDSVPKGKSVIISPYAKSVTALPMQVWNQIVEEYTQKGFKCFTNVVGDEIPLDGTSPISPLISEMKSVVEWAGTFVGIRSGLCDVIRAVDAEKIALYPDYNYSDTKWKAVDMYSLDGWKNIVVGENFEWRIN